ncbi:MAG: hypothetical protein ACOZCL_11015 [Bacillota bacterium]
MSVVVFSGTIIDIIRINLAEQKVEGALYSASRSVLAAYNKELINEYGIFGVSDSNGSMKEDLYKYIMLNLSEKHHGFRVTQFELDPHKLQVIPVENLASKDSIKQQILEYMKYRAPINITEGVIDKIKAAKLDKSMEYSEKAAAYRKKSEMIKGKLNNLNNKIKQAADNLINISEHELESTLGSLTELKSLVDTFANAEGPKLLEDFKNDSQALKDFALSNNLEAVDNSEFSEVLTSSAELKGDIDDVIARIRETKALVDDLKAEISRIASDSQRDTEEKVSIICGLQSQIDILISNLKNSLRDKGIDLIKLSEIQNSEPEHKPDRTSLFNEKLNYIKNNLLSKSISESMLLSETEFQNQNADAYYLNEIYKSLGVTQKISAEESEKENDNIIAYFRSLMAAIGNAAADARDKLYTIEYAMDKFTFLTSKTVRDHYFRKGEIEYIISGKDVPFNSIYNSELVVISDVISKIWFLRFSIDSISHFARSKIPHPLPRLGWALVEGAIDAALEMIYLIDGDYVSVCPGVDHVKLRYSDHLRLLLLMQSEDETIRKIQQLIQVNMITKTNSKYPEFSLTNCSTVIKVEAEVRLKLIFIPLFGLDKLGYKSLNNGCYVFSKSFYSGY